jgi:hypothetical protein
MKNVGALAAMSVTPRAFNNVVPGELHHEVTGESSLLGLELKARLAEGGRREHPFLPTRPLSQG